MLQLRKIFLRNRAKNNKNGKNNHFSFTIYSCCLGHSSGLKTRGYSSLETFLIQLAIIIPIAFLANMGLWIYIKVRNHIIAKHDINSEN